MSLAVFARAAAAILDRLGEPSTLNGTACGNVNLQRAVLVDAGLLGTPDDNRAAEHDVATFLVTSGAKVGDVLVHPDGTFVLDALLRRNAQRLSFVVVAA